MQTFLIARNSYLLLMLALGLADYFWLKVPVLVYLAPSLLFLLLVIVGSSVMSLNFFTTSCTRLDDKEKALALTFDDGPSAEHTPAVLHILEEYGATASFFCIGERMECNKELVREIIARGHTIGNHSYTHSPVFSLFNKKKVVEEIMRTNALIKETTGQECRLFRPPFGVLNPQIAKAATACGMRVIGWNIRSYDTTSRDPEKVVSRVLSKIKPGSVILLHDNREHAATILRAILAHAKAEGYHYKPAHALIA